MLDIRAHDGKPVIIFGLSLTPFRRVIRDYSIVCESYYAAMQSQSLTQVEAIDMGRRAVHNEGADLLIERLQGKVEIDRDTARRLFTLIYVLRTAGSSTMPAAPLPRVLFICTRNAVRSPMAEGLLALRRGDTGRVSSAGLFGDPVDPLAVAAMAEIGVDLNQHHSHMLADVALGDVDLVISLSSDAARAFDPPPTGVIVEHWDVDDPTESEGNRDARLEAYRQVRIALERRIAARFSAESGKMP
jgi:protein-tyrosine-phosphatase